MGFFSDLLRHHADEDHEILTHMFREVHEINRRAGSENWGKRDRLSACSTRDHTESGTSSWVDISGHSISWLPRRIKTSNGRYGHNHKAFRIRPEPHFRVHHDSDVIDDIYRQPKQCTSPCSREHVLSIGRRVLHR